MKISRLNAAFVCVHAGNVVSTICGLSRTSEKGEREQRGECPSLKQKQKPRCGLNTVSRQQVNKVEVFPGAHLNSKLYPHADLLL